MKRLIFLVALLYSGLSYGQNFFVNVDFEGASLPAGWEQSTASASSDGWKLGTSAQLSTTGANAAFVIPEHTKMVATNDDKCGQNCDKSNDVIYTPVFDLSSAQAAFMKFDAFFLGRTYQQKTEKAYIAASVDSGQTWFALAEIPGSGGWQTYTVNLDTLKGKSKVRLAFQYADNGGWLFGFALDNVQVFEPTVARQIKLTSLNVPEFNVVNLQNTIKGTFLSTSAEVIKTAEINWRLDGGAWQTSTITGLNVMYNQMVEFTHPIKFTLPDPKKHNLEVMISKVNGEADDNATDNQLETPVYGQTSLLPKHVVVEEFSGAWCGWCPVGHVLLKALLEEDPNVHGVVVHNQDAMTIADGPKLEQGVGIGGFPSMVVDRTILEGEFSLPLNNYTTLIDKARTRLDDVVPAEVFIEKAEINRETGDISIDVQAKLYGEYDGRLRFNAYIVEDSVDGTGDGWDQHNYTSNIAQIAPGLPNPNYQKGDLLKGYKHMHVLRAFLEGVWGAQGSFPSGSVQAGETYTHNFTHTLEAGQDWKNVYVIVTVAKYNTTDMTKRNILNASKSDLMVVGIDEKNMLAKSLQVYPNPTNGVLNINYNGRNSVKATVTNALGQNVGLYDVIGATTIDLTSMTAGVYVLNFNDGVNTYTHKIIVQ